MHRPETVHRDLRPENILIEDTGTVKLIDLDSVQVAGLSEPAPGDPPPDILGTEQYSAPEFSRLTGRQVLGEWASPQSDLYSLEVIAYQAPRFPETLPGGVRVRL